MAGAVDESSCVFCQIRASMRAVQSMVSVSGPDMMR